MKTKLLFLLLTLSLLSYGQFSENFDASTTLPSGWSVINGGDTNGFTIGPASTGSALTSPNSVYIVYSATAHDDYLVTPAITVTAGLNDRLTYFVKNQDPAYVESYEVKLSTATATAADFTTTLTPLAQAPNSWTQFVIDLTPYVGQTVYVGFHAVSTDMFRLHFDNIVNDTAPLVAPDCATLTAPADNATNVASASVTFTWSAPTSGGPVEYYDLYADTNADPTTKIGSYVGTTATVTTLLAGTTYHWKVVPKNAAGSPTSCSIYTFTTQTNPFAPYCSGSLLFSSGVEPITNVTFAGINNTTSAATTSSSHEAFVNLIGTVQQGQTYPITFQGYTGGNFTNKFIVFIDWNQDGDFADAGETYFGTSGTTVTIVNSTGVDGKTATGNIDVPATALTGNTRMRVKKNFGSTTFYLSPCYSSGTTLTATSGTTGYGQAEDYTINVTSSLSTSDVNKTQLAVYPNPVKDVLSINSSDKKVLEVTFYSVDGKLIKTFKNVNSALNVKDLKAGMYLVKVKTSDTEKTFKVIKE